MVLTKHRQYYSEIFNQIDMIKDKTILMFGYQEISPFFSQVNANSFKAYLLGVKKAKDVKVVDYKDERADVHVDMNMPTKAWSAASFDTCIDIGCLEHVFSWSQAMANCLGAVKLGGHYMLCTPVSGYYNHGFHTFDPTMLKWVLEHNGYEMQYCKYSTKSGNEIPRPVGDTLIWLVAKRIAYTPYFKVPVNFKGREIEESIHQKQYMEAVFEKQRGVSAKQAGEAMRKAMNEIEDAQIEKAEISEKKTSPGKVIPINTDQS